MSSKKIILLGPPSLETVLSTADELLNHSIAPFEDIPVDELPLPTLSTFNPDETAQVGLIPTNTSAFEGLLLPTLSTFNPDATTFVPNAENIPLPTLSTYDPNETTLPLVALPPRSVNAPPTISKQSVHQWLRNGEKLVTSTPPTSQIWRVLPTSRAQLHSGYTQPSFLATPSIYNHIRKNITPLSRTPIGIGSTTIITPFQEKVQWENENTKIHEEPEIGHASLVSFVGEEEDSEEHSEASTIAFLEHSFAVHNVPSSHISIHTSPHKSIPFREEDHEYASIYAKLAATKPNADLPHIPLSSLTEIEDLPTASELINRPRLSLVSMLVVIVAISELRTIRTKNPIGEVQLLTVTVADESAAGFEIKIWLPSANPGTQTPEQLNVVQKLQVGDITLFEKIGLSVYCDVVSASTLRHDRTRIILVYRESARRKPKLLENDSDQQVKRVRALRDWARQFANVAPQTPAMDETIMNNMGTNNVRNRRSRGKLKQHGDTCPKDTQHSESTSIVKTRSRTRAQGVTARREVQWKKRKK